MFKSLFIKLYITLLVSSIALTALSFLSIYAINYVNKTRHIETISAAPLSLLKSAFEKDTEILNSNTLTQLPGLSFKTISYEETKFSSRIKARLKRGFTYYEFTEKGQLKAYIQLDTLQDELLAITLKNPSYTLTHALPKLLQYFIENSASFELAMKELEILSNFDVSVTQVLSNQVDQKGNPIAHYQVCTSDFCQQESIFVNIPYQNKSVSIGPIPVTARFPYIPALIVITTAFCGLGLILFLQLKKLNSKFRKIEHAAYKISRGDLNTRIDQKDQGSLGRMAEAFNTMAEHIQRLLTIQREMIRAVSHELRTPVARIRFGVQMIEDFANDPGMETQLQAIDNDIQELDDLIDEILTYARLEEGGPIIEFQNLKLKDIVEQVCTEQTALADKDMEISYVFSCDTNNESSEFEERYIHRAIQNLVGNARRYAKSTVRVKCHLSKDTCRVDVEDDGPGIPEKDWDRVFTPFARLDDSRTRASGGYGLGLSIVRRITYWHGGKAMITKSADLKGAKFSLIWPREQP
ncbi:ATP-binding protein [Litoribacillus peritrichatus]|uniref:histidine kinase n=1 Tax=Litoribacillus peritrichatus TaxID=718191 RepID=A0ABP7MJ82_9GAMM